MSPTPKIGIVYIITTVIGVVFVSIGAIVLFLKMHNQPPPLTHFTTATTKSVKLATSTRNTTSSLPQKQIFITPGLRTTPEKVLHNNTIIIPTKITTHKKIIRITQQTLPKVLPEQKRPSNLPVASASIRKALVNITCEIKMVGSIIHTSGSGVFISPKGYIITNAHVAQYLLLKNYPHTGATTCAVRTGSPARARYTASVVFLSSDWMYGRASTTLKIINRGTENGKHDIAILAISGAAHEPRATNGQVPSTFPFVALGNTAPTVNEPVIIGSYAAQFLSQELLQSALYPTIAYGSIKKIYTLASTTADVATLGGTVVAQEGSSGGEVINKDGKLTAMIVIGTVTGPTNKRNLATITAQYIRRDYKSTTGKSIAALLSQSTTTATMEFASTAKKLSTYLKRALTAQ